MPTNSESKYFFLRMIPPRPTFAQDMDERERAIMLQHSAYWKEIADRGIMLVFGPVMEPGRTFGIGVLAADNEEQVRELLANDPAVKARIHKSVEFFPMKAVLSKFWSHAA